ncbi:MAG: hypothetical protein JNG85_10695 [Spirochaetaceae bacterium]|nr:hypothetical protein [Spirochaetaceae bacterium]
MDHVETNLRFARLAYKGAEGSWYALDNAACIMPAVAGGAASSLFRLSATLDTPVKLPALEEALERTLRRFPYFVTELRPGLFWHYLEPATRRPRVVADARSPCQDFDMHRRGTCLFRVRARERTIACEFAHVISDGTGGIRFLKKLLVEYFRVLGVEPVTPEARAADPDLAALDEPPHPEECEDAYNRHFPWNYPYPAPEGRAFHIECPLLPLGDYRVIVGILPLKPTIALAKSFGVSLTDFLIAVYMDALQEMYFAAPARIRRARPRIAIEVPVNMRQFYETRTNRNFSLFVHAEEDPRLGRRALGELAKRVHHQLRRDIDKASMARHIARNVSGGRLLPLRATPLPVKMPIMRFLFSIYGENKISGVFSNLGSVVLPEAVARRVERLDLVHAPSPTLKTKIAIMSWRDTLHLSFGSLGTSRELERLYLTRLRRLGLPVKVECNLSEDS